MNSPGAPPARGFNKIGANEDAPAKPRTLSHIVSARIDITTPARQAAFKGGLPKSAGAVTLSLTPSTLGVGGYLVPIAVITAGYALFQTANNTAVMKEIRPDQRGVISGMLNLSRNLGLITGASVMGAVFALGSATTLPMTAHPEAVAAGMRITFAVAAVAHAGHPLSAFGLRAVRGWAVPLEQLERLDDALRAGPKLAGGVVLTEASREALGWTEAQATEILKGLGFGEGGSHGSLGLGAEG